MRSSLLLPMAMVAGLVVGFAAPAHAAEDPAALVQQAKNLRLAGDDEGAYRLYLRAHNLARSAETAAHLGMAEINLALWVDAEAHLREALKKPNDPFIARNRVPIVEQLKMVRTHLGMLEVVGRPSGAEVEVGGKPVGRLPLPGPLRVPTGELNVRVAAEGFRVERRDVTIQPGQLHRVAVELEPQPPPGAGGPAVAARGGPGYVPSEGALRAREAPLAPAGDRGPGADDWKRPAAWVSTVAAVALTGAGLLAVMTYNADIDKFNNHTSPVLTTDDKRCANAAADKGGAFCKDLLDHAAGMKRWAILGFGGGAVAGVAALVLFANSQPADVAVGRDRGLALSCAPSLGAATGAVCAFRF